MHPLLIFIFHLILLHFFIISFAPCYNTLAPDLPQPACRTKCGALEVKYPFGTGQGCGSPRFHPYVTCTQDGAQLLLTTHTGSYPVTSISYPTSTLTITPPSMSNCTCMQTSTTVLGLDWASPFQLGPSSFILLSCNPSIYSLTMRGNSICDPSSTYLCASIYTCPAVVALGLPLFPPTNTCCVYSPANLDSKDELDLRALKCNAYTSVISLGDAPLEPGQWQYGVSLKYTLGGLDIYNVSPSCHSCELSGGVCGYSPPRNSFVCVCDNGANTTSDCFWYKQGQWLSATSTQLKWKHWWLPFLAVLLLFSLMQ